MALLGDVSTSVEMRPVETVADAENGTSDRSGLRFVTRAGHAIENLSLEEAIEIARVLG